jgi:ubiquitin C-terminal hydrolase
MNSALQCLSNTFPLTQYFLEGWFVNEINKENPLGSNGVLAYLYSQLLNEMWFKTSSVFSPF